MFYSKSTGGFYASEIHGDAIPADAVEITADEHAALLAGQSQGKLIQADAKGKPVYWINNRAPGKPWIASNNALLAAAAKRYKNLTIIDWYGTSEGHASWFYSDMIHPQDEGVVHYTKLVADQMAR